MHKLFESFRILCCFLAYFLLSPGLLSYANDNTVFIRIGTASISGVYYATGAAVCKFLKKESHLDQNKNIFCSVQSTPGAMYNLNALRNGDLEVAIAQSDWESHALNGEGVFKSFSKMENLRSIFTTHKEAFTVMVKEDSDIKTFDDIQGKIVNIGAPGTGVRGTIENIMSAKGWSLNSFKLATELSSAEQAQALCDGKIDVMINVIGYPNGLFQEASATCSTKFIPLDNDLITKLQNLYSYYDYYEIPTKHYMVNNEDLIPTIAVRSTFCTRSDFPDEDVYKILKSVFDNFSSLKSTHPAFSGLTKSDLVPTDSDAPIHQGAIKYYKKVGLL